MTRPKGTPILCPTCQEPMRRVVNTVQWQCSTRRRRECPNGHRVWTREAVEETPQPVGVKSNGRAVPTAQRAPA